MKSSTEHRIAPIVTHWRAHTLSEVVDFLNAQHPEVQGMVCAASKRLGVSPQAVSAIFRRDDASLSWVEGLAAAYGYQLRLAFPTLEYRGVAMSDRVARADYPNAGNLIGLVKVAKNRNLTINALSIQTGVNYRTIERAFKKGDIKVSTLKRIAEKLEIKIAWIWQPIIL